MSVPPMQSAFSLDSRGLPPNYPFKPDWEVTPRQTRDALAAGAGVSGIDGPLLIDCRLPEEHATCHIKGALLAPMQAIMQLQDEIAEAAGSQDRPIIVHCHHGRRSLQVTATLRGLGYRNVKSMAGGIDLWSLDIDSSVRRY